MIYKFKNLKKYNDNAVILCVTLIQHDLNYQQVK